MNITLKRIAKRPTYTIGKLYIDDVYFCDTIEDVDRNITNQDKFIYTSSSSGYWEKPNGQKIEKVYSETAIPTGTYNVTLKVKSAKYSNFNRYSWSKPYNAYIPRLLNVPGFDGILIHPGNTAKDSAGCILVGQNKEVGKVLNSTNTFHNLMKILLSAKDNIILTIQ